MELKDTNIIIKELKEKYDFEVKEEYTKSLTGWLEYMKGLKVEEDKIIVEGHLTWTKDSVLGEVVDWGKCKGCEKPEWITENEYQGDSERKHLICKGCDKVCDKGEWNRDNGDNFNRRDEGVYIFRPFEEYYCKECKFELLCGDCGEEHGWDEDERFISTPEHEDFALCDSCVGKREYDRHREKHAWENKPDKDCNYCEEYAETYNELTRK